MIIAVSIHPKAGEMRIEHAPYSTTGPYARLKFGCADVTIFLQPEQVAELQHLCGEYVEARRAEARATEYPVLKGNE